MISGRKINSNSQEWCTPLKYVSAVRAFLGEIELDPCSNNYSIVQAKQEYKLPEYDGLKESWNFETIFVNPPYGIDRIRHTSIKDWLARCAEAKRKYSSEVMALVPVATNTRHWKEYVFCCASSVCFLADTRLKFANGVSDKGAPMACSMIYWGRKSAEFRSIFSLYGTVVDLV